MGICGWISHGGMGMSGGIDVMNLASCKSPTARALLSGHHSIEFAFCVGYGGILLHFFANGGAVG